MLLTDKDIDDIIQEGKDKNDPTIFKDKIQESVNNYFESIDFNGNEIEIRERLYRMIQYAISRYDHYDSKRQMYMNLGLSLIGISTTFIGLTLKFHAELSILGVIVASIAFMSLFFNGLLMVKLFNDYTSADYPYRKIVNIQSWYFKYKFKGDLYYKLSDVNNARCEQIGEASKNYLGSIKKWIDLSKRKNSFIKEDLEQVAVLQFLQKFGSDCVKKMKSRLNWSLIVFTIFFVIFLLIELFVITVI